MEDFEKALSRETGLENYDYGRRGSAALNTRHLSIRKEDGTSFAETRLSLGRYSSMIFAMLLSKVFSVLIRRCVTIIT
jgi:hypothetical protein